MISSSNGLPLRTSLRASWTSQLTWAWGYLSLMAFKVGRVRIKSPRELKRMKRIFASFKSLWSFLTFFPPPPFP